MDSMNVEEYKTWIGGLARRFKQSQIKAATVVNVEMLKFYWSLGADIVRLEKDQPWGSKFMQRVSADLKTWMPEAKCFSPTNLKYMRRFFKLYSPASICSMSARRESISERTIKALFAKSRNMCAFEGSHFFCILAHGIRHGESSAAI